MTVYTSFKSLFTTENVAATAFVVLFGIFGGALYLLGQEGQRINKLKETATVLKYVLDSDGDGEIQAIEAEQFVNFGKEHKERISGSNMNSEKIEIDTYPSTGTESTNVGLNGYDIKIHVEQGDMATDMNVSESLAKKYIEQAKRRF